MTSNDRTVFSNIITVMAETFKETLSTPRVELYWRVLADLSIDDVTRACDLWLQQGQRFPVPAQLRELVLGTTEDRAATAWAALWDAAKRIDAYRSLLIEDGALAFAFETTFKTWPSFCGMDLSPEMWAAKRKEFTALYRAGMRRGCQPKLLIGHFERSNREKGFKYQELPGYIGPDHRVLAAAPDTAHTLGTGDNTLTTTEARR